ncbi:MAG: hypothetical protein ACI9U2_001741 [Bradymonadia bacterium]|jgi:hypothetical protein
MRSTATRLMTILAFFLGAALALSPALADTHAEPGAHAMPTPIELGPAHAHFKTMAGNWTMTQTMFMPDGKTMEAKGTQTVQTVLDGLGMSFETRTAMGPMTMKGHGATYWVPAKKMYQSTWFDNMSHNGMWTGWSSWDAKTKTMKETISGPGPDGKEMTMRMVTVVAGADAYTTTFYMPGTDGKEMKGMQIAYARVK